MRAQRPTVVWICGAPGSGKSAAAWALFESLVAEGIRVAHVDIDQLGMLYPAEDEPQRHLLKAEALSALLPGYFTSGAQVVVVSGVVDPEAGPVLGGGLNIGFTVCLLNAGASALRSRILGRGWDSEDVAEAIAEEKLLRAAEFVDVTVETIGLTLRETVDRLRAHVTPGAPVGARRSDARSAAEVDTVVVTGPRAVGSSTIAFGLATARWRDGRPTGFLDLQQLGFLDGRNCTVEEAAALAISQLARMHTLLAARGAEFVVVSGHLTLADRQSIRHAFSKSRVSLIRLRGDEATIEAHVHERVAGSEARLAGDDLRGAGPAHQSLVVAAAVADQAVLDAAADDDVVDVSRRTVAEVLEEIELKLGSAFG
jgi:broad-specificity NMP kinase